MSHPRRAAWCFATCAALLACSAAVGWGLRLGGGLTRDATADRGVWVVPAADLYEVRVDAVGESRLVVDEKPVAVTPVAGGAASTFLWLDAGEHEIAFEHGGAAGVAGLSSAPAGRTLRVQGDDVLRPSRGTWPGARRLTSRVRDVTGGAGIGLLFVGGLMAFWLSVSRLTPRLVRPFDWLPRITPRRVLRVVLVSLVIGYAALLRFDALAATRGPVDHPEWLRQAQVARQGPSALRPAQFVWVRAEGRYISDPYTYLQYARDMTSFYAAHRREPLFPFATKVSLALLDDQDIAVSFASGVFSVLAVALTFCLGAAAVSYWVGLGAAAGMAIEYQVVTSGVEGWRDDAFTCAVLLVAWALVVYGRRATYRHACLLGLAAGAACLVRITSLSFVVPGVAWLLLTGVGPWRTRIGSLAPAALIMTLIVAPFLVNCWRVYGDPLYAINVHADVYREAAGERPTTSGTTASYLSERFWTRPAELSDTALLGMTRYPFANKWTGFDRWWPGLNDGLAVASLVGLAVFLATPAGRLLLVVLFTSLAPYATTWRLIGDWRFTQHAYPILLIAACAAVATVCSLAQPGRLPALRRAITPRRALGAGVTAVMVLAGLWLGGRTLPVLVARETLLADGEITLTAGNRDRAIFGEGWSRAFHEGAVSARVVAGDRADVWLPLPEVRDYDLVLRLDPFPRPLGAVADEQPTRVTAMINGESLRTLRLAWNPERVGAYELRVPASAVTAGWNRVRLASLDGRRFRMWYARVRAID